MDGPLLARAVTAAATLARTLGLPVDDAVVIQNSNKVALRLLPGDVFARVAPVGQEVAAFEIEIAQALAAAGAPAAALDPRVDARVYERDGVAVTFWTYYRPAADGHAPVEYAQALHRLHAAMREVRIEAPHVIDRVADAEQLMTDRDRTPALNADDRGLMLDVLRSACPMLLRRRAADQLLHGEPHPGNLLSTADGPRFIDFETCCRGSVEFDVAHVPDEVSRHYPGMDQALLQECRRLVLAMVASWRWDVADEFPDGQRHGRDIIRLLRAGPPWPALGALSTP